MVPLAVLMRWYSTQFAEFQKFPSQLEPSRIIQPQDFNGCTSRRRQPLDLRSPESEVILPSVTSRMEQILDTAGQRIYPAQIGSLVQVAAMACQCEILQVVGSTVLAGNHMLNMVREFAIVLMQPTILASLSGPLSDEPPRSGVDHS
jgi:hypothetical protein